MAIEADLVNGVQWVDEGAPYACNLLLDVSPENYFGEGTVWDEETSSCIPEVSCLGDFNSDDIVNAGDLLLFLQAFGSACN
ncbi:MAG: hypothetical protein HRT74_11860 [Flavobacteriales bacterium]|nr:hypothetical protein [Flavobacteriales bacterium]